MSWLDLRLAFRTLRATPIVTIVAIASLALGIGANTAIFSLVDALMLRPLPVAAPHRLVTISSAGSHERRWAWNYAVWDQIRQRPQLFDGAIAWSPDQFNLSSGGETQFVDALWASGSFFSTLGVPALLGRTFSDADDMRGGGPDRAVVIISYGFWQRRFGGAADAIGRTMHLDSVPFRIVGVTPPDFFGLEVGRTFDVIVPLGTEPLLHGRESWLDQRGNFWLKITARLHSTQTLDSATSALRQVQRQIWEATVQRNLRPEYRERYLNESFVLLPAAHGESDLRRTYEQPLIAIFAVAGLVLLIACANVANLMLARGAARRAELAVRLALGASRSRLIRQLLGETLLMAAAGAGFGLLIAIASSRLLVRQIPAERQSWGELMARPAFLDLGFDWRMLMFTSAVAIATATVFGVFPAFRTSDVAPIHSLNERSHSGLRSGRARPVGGLIVAQMAISLMLVVAAGLLVGTFAKLATRDAGFTRDPVLLVSIDAQHADVPPAQRAATYERVREAVRALPAVGQAAVSIVTPVGGNGLVGRLTVSGGATLPEDGHGINGFANVVSPGWFGALGIPIVGRDFSAADRTGAPRVAIVNQALARKALDGANPLGRTITLTTPGHAVPMEIVGMAADSVYSSLREDVSPTIYTPLAQFYMSPSALAWMRLIVRSKADSPALLTKPVAGAIGAVNPQLALTFRPLADQVTASLTQERVVAILAGLFGGLALMLAALGLYGVTAYSVARQRREIGIRMALGAAPSAVLRLVLSRMSLLVLAGIAVGIGGSLWLATFIKTLLYRLEPSDPPMLIGATLLLATVAASAAWLPARHAVRVDPAAVLREA